MLTQPCGLFRETTFRPLRPFRGVARLKFLHMLKIDQVLLAHTSIVDGGTTNYRGEHLKSGT